MKGTAAHVTIESLDVEANLVSGLFSTHSESPAPPSPPH